MSTSSIFYHKHSVTTVINGQQYRSVFQANQIKLSEKRKESKELSSLLTADTKGSISTTTSGDLHEAHTYSVYGNCLTIPSPRSLLGYNGERAESMGIYMLGQGYRALSTVLMRFLSSDNLAPFGKGGINPYVYCAGDPVNYTDPSGHMKYKFHAKTINSTRHSPDMSPTPLGHFDIPGIDLIIQTLNRHLPTDSLTSLATTSKSMHKIVTQASDALAKKSIDPYNLQKFSAPIKSDELTRELPGVMRSSVNTRVNELWDSPIADLVREQRDIEVDKLRKGYHVLDQETGRHKGFRDLRGTDANRTFDPLERRFFRRNSI